MKTEINHKNGMFTDDCAERVQQLIGSVPLWVMSRELGVSAKQIYAITDALAGEFYDRFNKDFDQWEIG